MDRLITVVIPTSGRIQALRRLLQSLSECSRPSNFTGVLLVVNGGAAFPVDAVLPYQRSLGVRIEFVPKASKSHAINVAIQRLDGQLLLFLDDDVEVCPNWLTDYANATNKHRHKAFFGGPTVGVGSDFVVSDWLRRHLPPSVRGWQWKGPCNRVDQPCFLGFNWAAYCEDLKAIGGFNEHIGPGDCSLSICGDETDVQARLLAAGCTGHYIPSAIAYHHVHVDCLTDRWAAHRGYEYGKYLGLMVAGAVAGSGVQHGRHQIAMHAAAATCEIFSPPLRRYNWAVCQGAWRGYRDGLAYPNKSEG